MPNKPHCCGADLETVWCLIPARWRCTVDH